MKRLIGVLISLITAFTAFGVTFAADSTNAYIDNGRLVIECQSGMSDTAVAAYYSGRTLCGAYLAKNDGGAYTFGIPAGYTKIRVWFTDEDEMRSVQIIDRTAITPPPVLTVTPSPSPTAEPTPSPTEEPTEDFDEGYGGFLDLPNNSKNENIHTFTFSVECRRALSSDKLKDDLRALLPSDGFIAPAMEYELTEGITVYDALMAAAAEYGFEIDGKPEYITGIGGLSEFSCGGASGWMYTVNGKVIMAPINLYKIQDGDIVQVSYTLSLGRDLGNEVE